MSLGNREDEAGVEAEPEELPDIGYLKQPAMDSLYFSRDKCVLLSQYGKTLLFWLQYLHKVYLLFLHINI